MLSRFKRKVMGQGITVKRTVRHARLLSPEFEYLRYLGMLRGLRIVAMYWHLGTAYVTQGSYMLYRKVLK